MRMRKKPNLEPRMEKCAELLISEPAGLKGKWRESFPFAERVCLELGCGKGRFTVGTAQAEPSTLLLALERVPSAMVIAMERARGSGAENIRFIDADAAGLGEMFADAELERIYINFCDPWPKSRDAKFRLTSPFFLRFYCDILPVGGQIHFKTDNAPLFSWSIGQLRAEGWELSEITNDLHCHGVVGVMTDYEQKFCAEGMKINRLVATKLADTLSTAAGTPQRLRNASLSDARGFDRSVADNMPQKDEL